MPTTTTAVVAASRAPLACRASRPRPPEDGAQPARAPQRGYRPAARLPATGPARTPLTSDARTYDRHSASHPGTHARQRPAPAWIVLSALWRERQGRLRTQPPAIAPAHHCALERPMDQAHSLSSWRRCRAYASPLRSVAVQPTRYGKNEMDGYNPTVSFRFAAALSCSTRSCSWWVSRPGVTPGDRSGRRPRTRA
jgi:hypothetical protein